MYSRVPLSATMAATFFQRYTVLYPNLQFGSQFLFFGDFMRMRHFVLVLRAQLFPFSFPELPSF